MELTVSNRTIIRIVVIVTAAVLLVRVLDRLHTLLIWVFTALFLTLALEPAVDRISRYLPWRSRVLAVFIVLILTVAVIGLLGYAIIPPFATQSYRLVQNLPASYAQFVTHNPGAGKAVGSVLNVPSITNALQRYSNQLLSVGGSVAIVVRDLFGGIISVVTVLLLTFFMVLEGPRWTTGFWKYVPKKTQERWEHILVQMHGTVTGYVNGNLIKSLIAIVATSVMLVIVGSPDVLALALLVGIFDLIPLVGATVGAILVCLVVLMLKGVAPAVIMAIFFLIFQQIENNVFQPLIFQKTVEVSPLVTTLALLVGAALAGLVGALIAIPVAASLQILVRYYLSSRKTPSKA